MRTVILTCAAAVTLLSSVQAQRLDINYYETHRWTRWWDSAPAFSLNVVGHNSTHAYVGTTEALQLQLVATGGTNTAGVQSSEIPPEVGTGFTQPVTVQVFLEALPGSTGQPMMKLEATKLDNTGEWGGDTLLTPNAWTQVEIPVSSMVADYKKMNFVLVENGSNGTFNVWVDHLMRDGQLWDEFESYGSTPVADNIDTVVADRIDQSSNRVTITPPAPYEGRYAQRIEWTSDADRKIELKHTLAAPRDYTTQNKLFAHIYVPSGTTPLPTISVFFWDGSNGSFQTGRTVAAHDTWDEIVIDISGIHTASPFNQTSVAEVKLVAEFPDEGGPPVDPHSGAMFFDAVWTEVPVIVSRVEMD